VSHVVSELVHCGSRSSKILGISEGVGMLLLPWAGHGFLSLAALGAASFSSPLVHVPSFLPLRVLAWEEEWRTVSV